MESVGVFSDVEGNSFCRNFSEEHSFSLQILHEFPFPLEHHKGSSFLTSLPEATMSLSLVNKSFLDPLNATDSNLQHKTLESSQCPDFSSSVFMSTPIQEAYYLSGSNHFSVENDVGMSMDNSLGMSGVTEKRMGLLLPAFPDIVMEETICIGNEDSSTDRSNFNDRQPAANAVAATKEFQVKRKFDVPQSHLAAKSNISSSEKLKKYRVSKDGNEFKPIGKDGESNVGSDGQSSSSYSSEDENASPETIGGAIFDPKTFPALNTNGKTMANRGSATYPQSLYARKRRERINKRLRILQNLVPNGTKVDISTMLEEAINYVKFLQLQIKLLSSDDLWMYAPLAYNGVDIGLNKKLSALL
ncbi:hypothetical protein SLEP1_g21719 [Rubroshorea leprosula]|uniref:BHLH domain-containing protein n=1 Tax=Rubroshorea leprosula TaxID=152421 RepID=A0AAV5J6X0_9ROSI|nr:hypothetical protein SLEP1_g21719 [Rubroshorea leprosula]